MKSFIPRATPLSFAPRLRAVCAVAFMAAWLGLPQESRAAEPPGVDLVNPVNGQFFEPGTNVLVQATAFDNDGSVIHVDFYVDGILRFQDTSAPYSFTYGDITAGSHVLHAVATDNSGLTGTSVPVTMSSSFPPELTPLVPNGSVWRYNDTGGDLGSEWSGVAFEDRGWAAGPGDLGYGDLPKGRPERTLVGFGPNPAQKHITTYFRHTFLVADPGLFTNLILRLLRDDGAVVYLNGREILRSNMNPTNGIRFNTLAVGPASDDGGFFAVTANVAPRLLVAGPNVLAVEVHQNVPTTPDMSFDLMLLGQQGPRPFDCNFNGLPDDLDIASGTSLDSNHDGIPDECQASISLKQLSFKNREGNFIKRHSQQGIVTVSLPQPAIGQLLFFNMMFDGRWVVHNLPIQAASRAGVIHEYSVGFKLSNPSGTPSPTGMVSWGLSPQPSAAPPVGPVTPAPVAEKGARPSTTSGLEDGNAEDIAPAEAEDFENEPTPDPNAMKVSRTNVPKVDEETNHCGPGAGARCLAWMSDAYCLMLTNAQSIYGKLKDPTHMMTTVSNGTLYHKIGPAIDRYLASNNVAGFTSMLSRDGSPADLVTALKGGKDVIMLMGWYEDMMVTNMGVVTTTNVRVGGHIVVATGATMSTNGSTTIDFQDDVFGDVDEQGDGKADDGKTRTATVKTNASGQTIITGFGATARFEGFLKVCPPLDKIVDAIIKQITGAISMALEGITPRLQRFSGGSPATPEELNELQNWSQSVAQGAGYLEQTLREEGAPDFAQTMGGVAGGRAQTLHREVSAFVRAPVEVWRIPSMLHLAGQVEDALSQIRECQLDPGGCGQGPRPRLTLTPFGNFAAQLAWDLPGVLQAAPNVDGPWANLPDASPAFITLGQPQRFFRVEAQPVAEKGCLYGVLGVISGECFPGDFICVTPCPPGGCPTPIFENGKWQIIVVNDNSEETCRVEVSPTVGCVSCDVRGRFIVRRGEYADPAAGKIRLQ